MADSRRVAWIAAIASICAAVISGFVAYQQKRLEADTKTKEIALQQSQFEAQERRRFEDIIAGLVPKLLSPWFHKYSDVLLGYRSCIRWTVQKEPSGAPSQPLHDSPL
jgi:hypothetical protein